MTEFAAFFFRNPLRGSFLPPRDRKQTLLRKNIFLLIALAIADSKLDSHIHVIVYDIVQKKKTNSVILLCYLYILLSRST